MPLELRKPELNWKLCDLDKRSVCRLNEIFGKEVERTGEGHLHVSEWFNHGADWDPSKPADPSRYMIEGLPDFGALAITWAQRGWWGIHSEESVTKIAAYMESKINMSLDPRSFLPLVQPHRPSRSPLWPLG